MRHSPPYTTVPLMLTTASTTQTDVLVVTATVSSTSVVLAAVTTIVSFTSTNVVSLNPTVRTPVSPTVIVENYCQPTGTRFRLTTQAGSRAGGLRYFGVENDNDSYIKRRGAPCPSNSD
ncbi:hypothetical protein Micbo1qcDRAFT_210426 [Microdochium bolleyi]|uniref:Uncharacterized protein n=1 Tax=Microdochium bolleyi TaxID=196109 RepID=A0A136IIG9_9PEZI|nr:hypothetical protein Micbo1qcDRAFT_210426 [Microdochium bolleyi]